MNELLSSWKAVANFEGRVSSGSPVALHQFAVSDLGDVDLSTVLPEEVTKGVYKLVGRLKTGGRKTLAYGFSSRVFSIDSATSWIRRYALGAEGGPPETLKFRMNVETEKVEKTDGDGLVSDISFTYKDVEVASVGEWNGKFFSAEDLKKVVADSNEVYEYVLPSFKLGHEDGDKIPAYGQIGKFRFDETTEKVFTTGIVGVPGWLHSEIEAGRYSRLSPEFFVNWTEPTTQRFYKRVFCAVAVLGVSPPAITNLQPLSSVYHATAEGEREYAEEAEPEKVETEVYSLVDLGDREGDDEEENSKEGVETMGDETKKAEEALERDREALANEKETFAAERKSREDSFKASMIRGRIELLQASGKLRPEEVEEIESFASTLDAIEPIKFRNSEGKDVEGTQIEKYFDSLSAREATDLKKTDGSGNADGPDESDLSVEEKIEKYAREIVKEDPSISIGKAVGIAGKRVREDDREGFENYRNDRETFAATPVAERENESAFRG